MVFLNQSKLSINYTKHTFFLTIELRWQNIKSMLTNWIGLRTFTKRTTFHNTLTYVKTTWSLNDHKSSLGIPNKLIKIAAQPSSIPLTYIYNHSIETGIVPDILEVSQVSPVYKGGDATDPSNYQPIATLSPFGKVLERLVYNQLYSFIDKRQIMYKYQFGFRKGYSTEQAILEITDNLKLATDKGQITCGLFLDLSKAFDTVYHEILLSKLYLYEIRGTPHNWFESYLHNRRQYVKIDSTKSSCENITCGIPEGCMWTTYQTVSTNFRCGALLLTPIYFTLK